MPLPTVSDCSNWLNKQGLQNVSEELIAMYGHAPFAIFDALQEGDKLDFVEFEQDLIALVADNVTTLDLAEKWQKQWKWLDSNEHPK